MGAGQCADSTRRVLDESELSTYTLGSAASDKATPADIDSREASIGALFDELTTLHATKQAQLEDELAREMFRDELRVKDVISRGMLAAVVAWGEESKALLNAREEVSAAREIGLAHALGCVCVCVCVCRQIDDIPKANTTISIVAGWRRDKQTTTETAVAALRSLGNEIISAKYDALSTYTFGASASDTTTPADVTQRADDVDTLLGELDALAVAKEAWLGDELAREKAKEEKRVAFANLASAFVRHVTENGDEVDATHFGYTLADVEAAKATIDADDADRTRVADEARASAVAVFEAGRALGVVDNAYSAATPASLESTQGALTAKLAERQARYATELARQQKIDAMCRVFKDKAEQFVGHIVATKDAVSSARTALADQLAFVVDKAQGTSLGVVGVGGVGGGWLTAYCLLRWQRSKPAKRPSWRRFRRRRPSSTPRASRTTSTRR